MADLTYTHPELVKRYVRLLAWAWSNGWDLGVTSASRGYDQQKLWYQMYLQGMFPNLVADPDRDAGPSPWGWEARGSMHMIQADGFSHALDIWWLGPVPRRVHDQAFLYGLRFPEPTENWHMQWWDPWTGIYPITEPEQEPDMTLEEFMRGIGREGDDQGCLKIINNTIHQKLDDGNWYTLADVWEFTHRHIKHIDEGS